MLIPEFNKVCLVVLLQVLDWASLLLNAHYTQLVLMPEAHEMLVSFHQVVEEQVRLVFRVKVSSMFILKCCILEFLLKEGKFFDCKRRQSEG